MASTKAQKMNRVLNFYVREMRVLGVKNIRILVGRIRVLMMNVYGRIEKLLAYSLAEQVLRLV